MRRLSLLYICLVLVCLAAGAQEKKALSDSLKQARKGSCWTLQAPLGQPQPCAFDTLAANYHRQAVPSLVSDAYATTGNLGCAGRTELYFSRPAPQAFYFADALRPWMPPAQRFYNVYTPFTQLSYNTGGNKQNTQDRLRLDFAGNANRRVGIGATLDYLYSKGMYQAQSSKDFTFGFSGYYKGDRYELQAYYHHYNLLNKENGGITDPLYITDPAQLQGGVSKIEPQSIPVNLTSAHSRINGQRLYINQSYNVGFWQEQAVNDTLTRDVYIPVTKFILTTDFTTSKHKFINADPIQGAAFWENTYFNPQATRDVTFFRDFSNTLGVSMVEGFKKWAKFSLSAYATLNLRRYDITSLLPDGQMGSLPLPDSGLTPLPEGVKPLDPVDQVLMWVGARLAREKGKVINYSADFKMGLVGGVAADIDLQGKGRTRFRLFSDTVQLDARIGLSHKVQPWLFKHYYSNHFAWERSFNKTNTFHVGGTLLIPWTKTRIGFNLENVKDYVYFDSACLPVQEPGSVQVFEASLEQKLAFGIWHWDNKLTYQTSSRQEIIPLPALALYSNMYLQFRAFKVLGIQIGLDCDYYTRYYAPFYQPATMAFCNQAQTKIGNYPLMNVYINCRLQRTRFFLMVSHVNQNLFSHDAFSMPLYPLNPRRFQLGLAVEFAN